jgi:hypothetical protein
MAGLSWKWAGLLDSESWSAYQPQGSRYAEGSPEAIGESELKEFLGEAESLLDHYALLDPKTAPGTTAMRRLAEAVSRAAEKPVNS